MTGNDFSNDDYVANLLKEDAEKTAKQYKLVGVDAYLPKKSRSGAPKPNTHFLRHIIRQTDSHNSALLAKEAEESRARLKKLSREESSRGRNRDKDRLTPPELSDEDRCDRKRKRQYRDDEPEHRHSRRTGGKDHTRSRESGWERDGRGDDERRGHRERVVDKEEEDSRRRLKHLRELRHKDHGDDQRRSHRVGDSRHKERRRRSKSRSVSRSSSPPRKHHRSSKHDHGPGSRRRSRERLHRRHSPETKPNHESSRRRSPEPDYDSDPLEAIVGPLPPPKEPPVRARGRGAHKASSIGIDARFSSGYDPAHDVHLNSDVEDDWGDALEAHRDRLKWRQQGADRLKAAGFSDNQIRRWEKGDEKTEEDVRWAPKGEGREWDRGKVLDDDGDVTLKPEWGRLT